MLDNYGRTRAALPKAQIEFIRVQLSPGQDGAIFVAVTATSVDGSDSETFELVDQELASDRVATIDDALSVIAEHTRRSFPAPTQQER